MPVISQSYFPMGPASSPMHQIRKDEWSLRIRTLGWEARGGKHHASLSCQGHPHVQ